MQSKYHHFLASQNKFGVRPISQMLATPSAILVSVTEPRPSIFMVVIIMI